MTRTKVVVLTGLLVALLLAGVVSYYASSAPDGLNRVAVDQGFDKSEKTHASSDSPVSGYSLRGVEDKRLSGGLAGVAGVGVTFLVAGALAVVVRRRRTDSDDARDHAEQGAAGGAE